MKADHPPFSFRMGLGIDILKIRGFSAHGRAEIHDLTVDFLAVVVHEAHGSELLTTWIFEDLVDLFVGNIHK